MLRARSCFFLSFWSKKKPEVSQFFHRRVCEKTEIEMKFNWPISLFWKSLFQKKKLFAYVIQSSEMLHLGLYWYKKTQDLILNNIKKVQRTNSQGIGIRMQIFVFTSFEFVKNANFGNDFFFLWEKLKFVSVCVCVCK